MNLKRMRYFVTVADELHFGRAAERLHMAQPPLSQQIRLLEGELEVQLFDRTTRRVELTEAGRMLYPHAVRLLRASDDAAAAANLFRQGETGTLRLGFVDSSSYDVMPRFLRSYREAFPKVDYELRTLSSDHQQDALIQRQIDIGIARVEPVQPGLSSTMIAVEPLMIAMATSDPLAKGRTVGLADLSGRPIIGVDRNASPSLFRKRVGLFGQHGLDYDPIIEATEYTTVLGLVAAGQGVAVVPSGVQSFQPPGLHYLPITDPEAQSTLVMIHRNDDTSLIVSHAIDTAAAVFAG